MRPAEIGTLEEIEAAAARVDAEVIRIDLNGQFRSAGSEAYIGWVDALLGLSGTEPLPWTADEDPFEVVVLDTPQQLEEWVRAREAGGHTARMSAGFCWPWSDPLPDRTLVEDVVIGGWRRPWNARPGKKVVGAPSASLWASDPRGIAQVGCIYTAQGFEYDYGGVVLGPDFVRRGETWVADPAESEDSVVRRGGERFDELISNT